MSLGKHKFYCEMCKKQCKDDNAFQQHKRSSQHQQNMLDYNEDPAFFIERFSKEVQEAFMDVVRTKYGYQSFVPVNRAYNEYIKDPYHTHLNSTRWATLSEFALDLQVQGLVETTQEVDGTGKEQIMIRVVDTERHKREVMAKLNSKESKREVERKREEKDIEKMIKLANRAQVKLGERGPREEVKDVITKGIFTFEVDSVPKAESSVTMPELLQTNQMTLPKSSIFSSVQNDTLSDLARLQKSKKTSLDKVFEHTTSKPATWLRPHLIVKIKNQALDSYKLKGEVISAILPDKIMVKLENGKAQDFREGDLGKVVPGEGGVVWLLTHKRVGSVTQIDLKTSEARVSCKDAQGNKERYIVKLDEMCKYNTNQ